MLLANRYEAIVGVESCILYTLKSLNITRDKLGTPLVLNTNTPRLQFSPKMSKANRNKLEQALTAMRTTGRIQAIAKKYLQ